jgi:hypothetical protein
VTEEEAREVLRLGDQDGFEAGKGGGHDPGRLGSALVDHAGGSGNCRRCVLGLRAVTKATVLLLVAVLVVTVMFFQETFSPWALGGSFS